MKKIILAALIAASFAMAGCQRVETGEVGLRQGWDKQIQKTELLPGSFNQTFVGDVMVFPVKQIGLLLKGMQPQTLDNSTLADLDITVIYNINPASVGELYTTESRSFHALNDHNETVLMYNYLTTVANSAAFKSVNKYQAMGIAGHRGDIETDVMVFMNAALKAEKLDMAITIAQVQVKNILPAQSIIDSANAVITAQNALKAKSVELQTATIESQRQDILSRPANINYMHAQAELNISEGVKEGKVSGILIPHGMTMFGGNVGK
jgi:hypothetical protein